MNILNGKPPGHFVERLINEDKHLDQIQLPRYPGPSFRNKKAYYLGLLDITRARYRANVRDLDNLYAVGDKVEALVNEGNCLNLLFCLWHSK